MHLVDMQNLLREETSLASFIAGFKLVWGIIQKLDFTPFKRKKIGGPLRLWNGR